MVFFLFFKPSSSSSFAFYREVSEALSERFSAEFSMRFNASRDETELLLE